MAAGDAVEGIVQLARSERPADFDLLAALPPIGVAGVEDLLGARLGSALLRDLGWALLV
jgi:hypothetical protein